MRLADQTLSIADFRSLGAFEIYEEAEVVAFARGKKAASRKSVAAGVPDDESFRLGDLFASTTKFRRMLWLARRRGVLPESLMRRFGHAVAQECLDRLDKEGALSDIRLTAGLKAHRAILDGERHLRSVTPLREAAVQASHDHQEHASERAADGCRTVIAALDPDAYEAGVEAAHLYLDLFPDASDERWIRACLRDLVEQFE